MSDKQTLRLQLGQALRRIRIARDLTQVQVALLMGKSSSLANQISRWELGKIAIGGDQLYALLIALDMTFADLHHELTPAAAGSNPRLQALANRIQALS